MARRALLLLDGIDEGGIARERVEAHVTDVLLPQGHTMLCTARPVELSELRFAAFRRFELSPLTEEQQQAAVHRRLGDENAPFPEMAALFPALFCR